MIQTNTLKAAGISEQDIQTLETAWEAFQSARNHESHQEPHIVCTGVYNAGKSTLLNALAGKEIFPTGDVPTTKKIAQAMIDGAVYIDTPGLNAAEEDDQETQNAYKTADFILFVSNAQNGGVSASEAAWLQKLKARYSSLPQRLIFVLTHCTQVEPEQLPAIREKVCGDLAKALQFTPEQVFCMDSVTYQDGINAREPLLFESSGMQQLKDYLSRAIANAEKTLKSAQKTEQSEIMMLLERLNAQCQQQIEKCSQQSQKEDEINRLLEDTDEKIRNECNSSINIGNTHVYHSPSTTRFRRMGVTSPLSVEKDAKDGLNSYAGECVYEAKQQLDNCLRLIEDKYYTFGMDSSYFKACSTVNSLLEKLLSALQQSGVALSRMEEVHVEPNAYRLARLPSEISKVRAQVDFYEGRELFDTYYDAFGNRFETRDIKDFVWKKTLFGEKLVEQIGTEINAYYAMSAAMKQIQEQMERFEKRATYYIGDVLNPFLKELYSAATERLSEFRKASDTYLSAVRKEIIGPYQRAKDALLEMENEVKQWKI